MSWFLNINKQTIPHERGWKTVPENNVMTVFHFIVGQVHLDRRDQPKSYANIMHEFLSKIFYSLPLADKVQKVHFVSFFSCLLFGRNIGPKIWLGYMWFRWFLNAWCVLGSYLVTIWRWRRICCNSIIYNTSDQFHLLFPDRYWLLTTGFVKLDWLLYAAIGCYVNTE